MAVASSARAVSRTVWVCDVAWGSVCDRVAREKSSKRSRSTTVRPTRPAARIRRVTRSTRATREASMTSCDFGDQPSARCDPIEPRRRPTCTRRGSRLWASACSLPPAAGPSHRTRSDSATSATSPTTVIPRSWSFLAVTGPTPQIRSTGRGWRNDSSPSGGTTSRPLGFATALATLARNLVLRDPDRDRQADLLEHLAPQPHGDLGRRARDSLHPAHVEEGLVDRQPFDQRRGVVEDAEHRLARLGVGRHARRDDDRVRAQAARLPAAHRGADAAGLRLVAGREHDAAADDHGPSAQARLVSLLDRRVERVQVGVQDRRLAHTNICSHELIVRG